MIPHEWHHYVPFLAMVNGATPSSQIVVRLVEAALIGAIVMVGTVQALSERIDGMKEHMARQDKAVSNLTTDMVELKVLLARHSAKED